MTHVHKASNSSGRQNSPKLDNLTALKLLCIGFIIQTFGGGGTAKILLAFTVFYETFPMFRAYVLSRKITQLKELL